MRQIAAGRRLVMCEPARVTRAPASGRVAFEASGLVIGGSCGTRGLVGIVAGHTAERAAALGIAAAAGPPDSLRSDPSRVFRIVVADPVLEDVAVVALLGGHLVRGGRRRVDDGQVGQTGLEGHEVIPPGPWHRSQPMARRPSRARSIWCPVRGLVT